MTHSADWKNVNALADFIKSAAMEEQPFLAYVGYVLPPVPASVRFYAAHRHLIQALNLCTARTDIVHPPYVTSNFWLNKVNVSKITIPKWVPINQVGTVCPQPPDISSSVYLFGCNITRQMHPEDLQSSMKKKMASDMCCDDDRKRLIRQVNAGLRSVCVKAVVSKAIIVLWQSLLSKANTQHFWFS